MLGDNEGFEVIKLGCVIAEQHHEKYDGSGYPKGLKGEQIDISARIVAIADVFDALSSKRVYKPAFPLEKTLAILQEGSATHFDPNLLEIFTANIERFLEIQSAYPDEDETPHIMNILEEYR